uniref:Uncharacterized protein n=1 Tax=Aplanochytrium stocchinoi TaxID=215587 RepID=A0A7S3V1C3_9STRA
MNRQIICCLKLGNVKVCGNTLVSAERYLRDVCCFAGWTTKDVCSEEGFKCNYCTVHDCKSTCQVIDLKEPEAPVPARKHKFLYEILGESIKILPRTSPLQPFY